MPKQNTEHRTRKQFEVNNTNKKKIQKKGVRKSKRLDNNKRKSPWHPHYYKKNNSKQGLPVANVIFLRRSG